MEPWIVATSLIFAYLILTLILGLVANRRLEIDMEDFLLYGRQAGFVVLYLTLVSTFYSSFAFLGSSGFFYTHGVGLLVLYLTAIVYPHPLTLHGGVWALGANLILTLIVSRFSQPPHPKTLERIHGTLEEFVYGQGEKALN